jgi:hypothetical protein
LRRKKRNDKQTKQPQAHKFKIQKQKSEKATEKMSHAALTSTDSATTIAVPASPAYSEYAPASGTMVLGPASGLQQVVGAVHKLQYTGLLATTFLVQYSVSFVPSIVGGTCGVVLSRNGRPDTTGTIIAGTYQCVANNSNTNSRVTGFGLVSLNLNDTIELDITDESGFHPSVQLRSFNIVITAV